MFHLITDLIIFCKKKLGLPLTPVPNHQVYQLLKDSTDSRVIPSRFRKRIKLMVYYKHRKYLKKSKPGGFHPVRILKLIIYSPAYKFLLIFLLKKHLLGNKKNGEHVRQQLIPTLLAPSQYDYKRHLYIYNQPYLKDYPHAYADELEADDWYEQDFMKTSYDEHMPRYGKSRPLQRRRVFGTFLKRLRGYRTTYLGHWYRDRKIVGARIFKAKFQSLKAHRMRLWNNYFSEKAKWWVRRKTKMPLKMIKENLLAWRKPSRTTFFSFRAAERMHFYLRSTLRYGHRTSLFHLQNLHPRGFHPHNVDITSSMHWQIYRPLSLKRRFYRFWKRYFWLIHRRYFSDRLALLLGKDRLHLSYHEVRTIPKLPYIPIIRLKKFTRKPGSKDYDKYLAEYKKAEIFVRNYTINRKKRLKILKRKFIIKIRTYGYKKFMRYKDWFKRYKKAQRRLWLNRLVYRYWKYFRWLFKFPAHYFMGYVDAKFDCTVIRIKLFIKRWRIIRALIRDLRALIESKLPVIGRLRELFRAINSLFPWVKEIEDEYD